MIWNGDLPKVRSSLCLRSPLTVIPMALRQRRMDYPTPRSSRANALCRPDGFVGAETEERGTYGACRERSENPMRSMPRRLACAETWASNRQTASLVELPDLTAGVHSVPVGPGHIGGDVHYVSVCPSCIVSRIALADVSGHGEAVAVFGEKLQELMQRYLRALEQIALMRDLNRHIQRSHG
jgi:hypothetical protein